MPNNKGELSGNLLKWIKRLNKPVLVTKQDQYIYNLKIEHRLMWKETLTKFSRRFKKTFDSSTPDITEKII